jgi:hypothetical protein
MIVDGFDNPIKVRRIAWNLLPQSDLATAT